MVLSTPLSRKLHTNDPPTFEEAIAAREALRSSLTKVQALENEIAHIQSRYNSLSLESRELTSFIKGHKPLLSPARRLLPEILQEVFYHCLPVAHNAILDDRQAPLLLGHVCSQWRQIAYSTPKLWTSIHISTYSVDSPRLPSSPQDLAQQNAISSWLSRSGVLPLSISMYCSGTGRSPPTSPLNNEVQPYLDLITPHINRWKSIRFTLHDFDWTPFFTRFTASDFPLLESLHIDGSHDRFASPSRMDLAILGGDNILKAPLLRVLSFPIYTPHVLDVGLRWKDLTGLDLGTCSLLLGDISRALTQCSNLEFCSVSPVPSGPAYLTPYLASTSSPAPYHMTGVTLPKLGTLVIINRSGIDDTVCQLFACVSAPALRHLSYERACPVYPDSPGVRESQMKLSDAIGSFLQRLIHPLEELSVWTNPFQRAFLMDILPILPELKRLSLKGYATFGSGPMYNPSSQPSDHSKGSLFLADFIPNRIHKTSNPAFLDSDDSSESEESTLYRPCICPKLEVFHFVDALFTDAMVVEFLRSRSIDRKKGNVAHLRRVSISFDSARSEFQEEKRAAIMSEIEILERETGLRVDLRYPPVESPHPFPMLAPVYSPYTGLGYPGTANVGATPPPHLVF